jgi:transketolase domain protein
MEVRKVFEATLEKMMRENENIVMLDADLAKAGGTFGLREIFPDRAFDVGIAEANMACVAAGLAAYGFVPFIHSFAPFASRRIFDQIAVSIAYGGNNVKIIGSDPGIAAELNGGTHMSFEDVAAMRAIPGMLIFEPVDARQMEEAMPAIVEYDGPVYVRMFRKETPDVFTEPDYKFNLFKADVLREGTDVSIFVTGLLTSDALRAADMLREEGVSAEVINIHTLKPVDRQAVLKSVKKTGRALTVENHSIFGGLHSAVCEILCEEFPVRCAAVAVNDRFGEVGRLNELKRFYGLTDRDIADKAKTLL